MRTCQFSHVVVVVLIVIVVGGRCRFLGRENGVFETEGVKFGESISRIGSLDVGILWVGVIGWWF